MHNESQVYMEGGKYSVDVLILNHLVLCLVEVTNSCLNEDIQQPLVLKDSLMS